MNSNLSQEGLKIESLLVLKSKPRKCIIDKMIQEEIERGVPKHMRTRVFMVSCPCPKCSPYSWFFIWLFFRTWFLAKT